MQEDIEQRTMSVTVQATKLSGRVLKAAIAAALQKMEQSRNTPKVGRNSMKRLTARDPGASTIEVTGRIRSFERIAKKHEVRYHIEKDPGTGFFDPENDFIDDICHNQDIQHIRYANGRTYKFCDAQTAEKAVQKIHCIRSFMLYHTRFF